VPCSRSDAVVAAFNARDVKDHTPTIALGGEKARKQGHCSNTQTLQTLGAITDYHRFDLHGDFAGPASFLNLGLMLQAAVQGHQTGRCVTNKPYFEQLRL